MSEKISDVFTRFNVWVTVPNHLCGILEMVHKETHKVEDRKETR
jgi:hypothetical protein